MTYPRNPPARGARNTASEWFLTDLALFNLASLICGLAPNVGVLMAGPATR
jgi:hypothetical protein